MWVKQDFSADKIKQALLIEGDRNVPPTKAWKLWLQMAFQWKTIVVFNVQSFLGTFRPGFVAEDGTVKLGPVMHGSIRFAARIGHEDCRFFALDQEGNEVILTMARRLTRKEYTASAYYRTCAPLV